MTRVETLYISAAINRNSQAADIARSSQICFASQNLLSLWEISELDAGGVSETLQGHQAEVNCVKFMRDGNLIASGDQHGVLQIRTKTPGSGWRIVITKQAHDKKPITSLATYGDIVVTGSSDATVKVWKLQENGESKAEHILCHMQTIQTQRKYPLDIQIAGFPGTLCLFLAIATTGRDVAIWTGTETQFTLSASLSGHEDWIKSLAFTQSRSFPPQLTLASGSQDGTIRLWSIDQIAAPCQSAVGDSIFDKFEAALSDLPEGEDGGKQMSTKRHVTAVRSSLHSLDYFAIAFDALLIGHEAGVTSLSWQFNQSDHPTLLSSSVDSSLIIWSATSLSNSSERERDSSLWISQQRFGDVGGQRFGGFTGAIWARNGSEILGCGWNGGWRRWRSIPGNNDNINIWNEVGAITGHQGVVKTIAWAPKGDYLLSTGLDQTTRIHSPCRGPSSSGIVSWHEIARPQVHGYDVVGAEFLSPLRFVSIADEKVARVFDAPRNFVTMVNSLGMTQIPVNPESRPVGANVPPLGLSNKAANEDESQLDTKAPSHGRYPFESELASATLWPETEKIFGHGYELVSVASSHSGSLVVTSCKSSTAEHAMLRVYDVGSWQLMGQPLMGHKLTVTRIVFSPNDDLLLTVSRDRTWRLFRLASDKSGFSPLSSCKAHERIVWDCAWMCEPSNRPMFATASRDKTVKIWQPTDDSLSNWTSVVTLSFEEAVTAVDFSPVLSDGRRRLAVGLENGRILLYSSQADNVHDCKPDITLDARLMHVSTVNRIAWRPSEEKGPVQQLATCSNDGTIKVMMVHLDFH
ncbi:WD40-repeat-containing domain protein [Hysterangium stoloniferum]|nr:WD40-repeat-containing domain protein [Hysterangium stoloniferum]